MPSAPAEVRAAARYLAPPLEDEGVARIVEGLVLGSPASIRVEARRLAAQADTARAVAGAPAAGPQPPEAIPA
jgi:hypothetical protein